MNPALKLNWQHFIFDLDDTLIDTSQLLIPIQKTPQFFERIQKPLPLMDGARDLLSDLSKAGTLYLITQGNTEVQKQKIRSANIESFFTKIFIANTDQQESKDVFFGQIFQEIPAGKTLAIGNRRKTDLRPAKMNGATTCWYKYGEYLHEPESTEYESPDYTVRSFSELRKICLL
jgi:FMN phosphatase YigB (HAD superfamily)